LPLRRRGLGGADVHVSVERHGAERNDLCTDAWRQFEADGGFAAGGGDGENPALAQQGAVDLHRGERSAGSEGVWRSCRTETESSCTIARVAAAVTGNFA